MTKIQVYIINLPERKDRLDHILQEFQDRTEFEINIIEAIKHELGSIGLWMTIQKILIDVIDKKEELFLLCEDDHQFTEYYSSELLLSNIQKVAKLEADILCGGPSWITSKLKVSENIYWMDKFTGLQFTIIYKRAYKKILDAKFTKRDCADGKIASICDNKFFIYPFISIQKEFGYSDATPKNQTIGRIAELFQSCNEGMQLNEYVCKYYEKITVPEFNPSEFTNFSIPTYIINLPERTDRKEHILNQFKGKNEFDVTIIEATKHSIGAVGLWRSIRKVVKRALSNDDDVILICEDDHEFTDDYCKETFVKNIIEAHYQGADYLSGGCGRFGAIIPLTKNRFWTSYLYSTQFIVIYRKFFQPILDEFFNDDVKADLLLSEMTSHKMILFPFISILENPPILTTSIRLNVTI